MVERLLQNDAERTLAPALDASTQHDVAHDAAVIPTSSHTAPTPGERRIGSYTLLDLLGEGGMGAVYLAQQDRPNRVVALKLIRAGLITPRLLRRFEHESELLARLQHPGIAQIYEAGTAETGHGQQPFFAMEYVRGPTLTDYARANNLDTRARLGLFIRVCEAVQHAHQKGVIHRDLKPANILVQTPDTGTDRTSSQTTSAQPKILDFGIARSIDTEAGSRTFQTEAGQLVGTLPYMSPEQIAGHSAAIDTRSDVYTLGVILFELLTGRLPHAVSDKTIPEAVRTISQDEPAPLILAPSDRSLRGEIQTIVGKALEKDRARRYQSAGDLAADIGRYLRNEPILAQPPSRTYLFRKFAARNRSLVGGACATLVMLIAGIIATSVQAVRTEHARQLARQEADLAAAANKFLTDMLSSVNPDQNNERELTVREMLDLAAERLSHSETASTADLRVAMSLHSTLSSTYRSLGRADLARTQAERSLAIANQLYGPEHVETLDAQRTLAMALGELADFQQAERLTRDALTTLERLRGPQHVETLKTRAELGRVLLEASRFQESEALLRSALDAMILVLGERHNDTLITMDHLGLVLQRLGRFEEAEAVERRGLKAREEVFGPDSTVTAFSLNNLANIAQRLGRNREAADLLQRALTIRQKRLDPEHPSLLVTMGNLAVALTGLGELDKAEALLRDVMLLQTKRLGEAHPKTLSSMGNLAYILEDQGKLDEAETLFRRVVEIRRRTTLNDQEAWGHVNNLAMLLHKRGKLDEASSLYLELLPLCESSLPADHYLTAIFRSNAGACLTDLHRFEEAETQLLKSQTVLERFFAKPAPQIHPRVQRGRDRLRALYTTWNKPEEAAKYAPAKSPTP